MGFPENLRRFRLASGLSQERLALACGWSGQSRIANYEAGSREPTLQEIETLADHLGVDPAELTDSGKKRRKAESEFATVNAYRAHAGLGAGVDADPDEYADVASLMFRADSLRRKGLHSKGLATLVGRGDSMLPEIHDGDTIMFDTEDTNPRDGSMFVIVVRGSKVERQVKRCMVLDDVVYFLALNPDGDHTWRKPVRADNKRSPIEIIGRVRWVARWRE